MMGGTNPESQEEWHRLMWLKCGFAAPGFGGGGWWRRVWSGRGQLGQLLHALTGVRSLNWLCMCAALRTRLAAVARCPALTSACLPVALHCVCSQELPAMKERLRGVQDQVEPTQAAAQALQDFIQHIEIDKVGGSALLGGVARQPWQRDPALLSNLAPRSHPAVSMPGGSTLRPCGQATSSTYPVQWSCCLPYMQPPLAEAESMRGAAISTLAQRLAQRRLPPLVRGPAAAAPLVALLLGEALHEHRSAVIIIICTQALWCCSVPTLAAAQPSARGGPHPGGASY